MTTSAQLEATAGVAQNTHGKQGKYELGESTPKQFRHLLRSLRANILNGDTPDKIENHRRPLSRVLAAMSENPGHAITVSSMLPILPVKTQVQIRSDLSIGKNVGATMGGYVRALRAAVDDQVWGSPAFNDANVG